MSKYDKVKDYYKKGLWDETRIRNAVTKGWITQEEFEEILRSSNSVETEA